MSSARLSSPWVKSFQSRVLRWYDRSRRALPWRGLSDPYRIWVSEVMLQQTRVSVVTAYYERFVQRFPDVRALARAPESAVLAAWSGLGYYRRARMLHQAAREVVRKRGGKLPSSAAEWRQLPGVGRYTAAAIASISSSEPVAVVDGNVERVVERLFPISDKRRTDPWTVAEALLHRRRPGDFNQAMMELGATVCLPTGPRCGECPVVSLCASKGSIAAVSAAVAGASRPHTRGRDVLDTAGGRPAVQRRKREIAYALALRAGRVRLTRRGSGEALMPCMWELPAMRVNGTRSAAVFKHSITITDYRVQVVKKSSSAGEWVPVSRLSRLPLTGLTRKILKHFQVIQ